MTTPLTPRQQHWSDIIDAWSVSGQSIAAFCRAQGISPDLFYAWKHTLKKKQTRHGSASRLPARFIPVLLHPETATSSICVTVNQVDVVYRHDTDEQMFLTLIRLLKGAA